MTAIGPTSPLTPRPPLTSSLNRQALDAVDRLAFDAYGDLDMWSKQAKQLACLGAEYAAKSAMLLNGDRVDGPEVQAANTSAIATVQRAYASTARDIAYNGYGDIGYWSKRAKRLAFETAATAATTAALCDGPMLASVQRELVSAMQTATTTAFDGWGDIDYWSARTRQIEKSVAFHTPQPTSNGSAGAPADARQRDLVNLTRGYLQAVGTRAFDGYGDTDFWSKESKRIALHTATHVARVGMVDAAFVQKSDAEQDQGLAEIEKTSRDYARTAQEAAAGFGDIDYWSKRTKHLALQTADHVAQMALQCDDTMITAMRPSFERLLEQVEDVAFNGYGDVGYWKDRCHRLGAEAVTQIATLRIEVQAERAARAAVKSTPPTGTTHDTRELETTVVRNRVIARELDNMSEPFRKDLSRLDADAVACAKQLEPLAAAESAAYKSARLDQKIALGGGLVALGATVVTGMAPLVGGAMLLGGVGALCLAMYRRIGFTQKVEQLKAEAEPVVRRKTQIDNERRQVGQTVAALDRRQQAAEATAAQAQKQLDVLRMANALGAPPAPAGRIDTAAGELRIGGIAIPRNGQ